MVGEECRKRTRTRECSRISFCMLLSCHFSQFPQLENLLAGYFPSPIKNSEIFYLQFTWTPLWVCQPLVRFDFNTANLPSHPGLERRNSLIWRRKSDDEYRWREPISVLFERQTSLHSFKMTKLIEWVIFAGLAFSIWITLLTDILPLKVSYKAKEVIWPVSLEMFDRTCGIKTIHRHSWNYLSLFIIA